VVEEPVWRVLPGGATLSGAHLADLAHVHVGDGGGLDGHVGVLLGPLPAGSDGCVNWIDRAVAGFSQDLHKTGENTGDRSISRISRHG